MLLFEGVRLHERVRELEQSGLFFYFVHIQETYQLFLNSFLML